MAIIKCKMCGGDLNATAAHDRGIIFLAYMVKECYDNKI